MSSPFPVLSWGVLAKMLTLYSMFDETRGDQFSYAARSRIS